MQPTLDPHDWATLESAYRALGEGDLTAEAVPGWLSRWSDLEKEVSEAYSAASRAKSEDTTDEAAQRAYLHLVEEVLPRASVAAQALKTKLLAVPGFTPGPEHAQMMRRLRDEADLFREENVPIHSDLAVLANEYDTVVGAMTVTLGGEEITLEAAGERLLEPDRGAREEAWRAIQDRWLEDRARLDDLFLKMLPLRRRLAQNAGLPDYRAYVWRAYARFDYTPEDCRRFHEAIEAEVVPLASRLLTERKAKLRVNALRPWDHDWSGSVDPESRPPLRPFESAAELEAGAARIFARVDPELGAEFERLRSGFLDLDSRKGKAPGGYCDLFEKSGMPYIFMNAVGTHGDVTTLLHEGGHAFHALASAAAHDLIWNHWAPTEFSEVGSMAMELLAAPYLERSSGGFYSREDAQRARREHLMGIVAFLPYMAVVDAFQHWVYADAPESVTAADLDAKWDELWGRFMAGVDWSGLEAMRATGWHRKGHIYGSPFYYIEYGLAQVGALQVWRNAITDQAGALRAYRGSLALGNTRPLPELFTAAGARLAFDQKTLGELVGLVENRLGA